MAGRVVGSISLKATVDGPSPVDARLAGEKAGVAMGDGMDSGWGKRAEKTFDRIGKRFEVLGKDSGDRFGKGFGTRLKNLFSNMKTGVVSKLSGAFDNLTLSSNRSRVAIDNHANSMKRWQAITLAVTALVLGAGNDIAVLGSAVGAGTFVLGAAISSLVIATGVAVAAFSGLVGDIDDMPAAVRPAAKAFQGLGDTFKDLRNQLTVSAFKDSEADFLSLGETIKGLSPALNEMATAVGRVVKSIAQGVAPGTKTFDQLNQLIRQSIPIFEKASKVAGTFGRAILGAFSSPRMAESVNKLLDYLGELGDAFETFTNGKGLDKWLDHADSVFGAVGRLASSLGKTLNGLVTDKSVKATTDFVDKIADFLPVAGQLIDIGGKLDPLNLIADALTEIGKALQPLIQPLNDLAESLNRVVKIAIKQWGDDLKVLSDNLAPIVQNISDFLDGLDDQTVKDFSDALLAFAAAAVVAKGANGILGLAEKIMTLGGAIEFTGGKKTALSAVGGLLAGGVASGIANSASTKDNPLETMIQTWTTGLVGGLLTGGPIGAALGLVGGILFSLIFDNETFNKAGDQVNQWMLTTFFIPIGTWLAEVVQKFVDFYTTVETGFATFLAEWGPQIVAGLEPITSGWATAWDGLSTTVTDITTTISTTVNNWLTGFIIGFLVWGGSVLASWNGFWNSVSSTVTDITNTINTTINDWLTGVIVDFVVWGNGLITNWNSFWNTVAQTVGTWIGNINATIQGGLNGLKAWWDGLWSSFSRAVSDAWGSIVGVVRGQVNSLIGIINGLLGPLNSVISLFGKLTGLKVPTLNIPSLPVTAVGGVFSGAQPRIIGEAGPEAVVPLNRPLSQVDPAVRSISAYAQGKEIPTYQDAGTPQVYFAPGSIVSPYSDPALVAEQAADKVAEKLAV